MYEIPNKLIKYVQLCNEQENRYNYVMKLKKIQFWNIGLQ